MQEIVLVGKGASMPSYLRLAASSSAHKWAFISAASLATLFLPFSNAVAQSNRAPEPAEPLEVQLVQPPGPAQSAPQLTITFQDALERARKLDPAYLGALSDAKSAGEDRLQARNAMLPQFTATTQYLNDQGDGGKISDGRFVTQDGVHVYRAWGVYREDLSPATLMGTAYTRAKAAEALASAKAEVARRGLTVAVSKAFYTLVVAQRKYATAEEALNEGKKFLDITVAGEKQGQNAHADELKAEVQYRIQKQAFDEARLAIEDARLDLSVFLFPTFNENFSVVDDLDSAQALPPFPDVQAMAEKQNPDLHAAFQVAREADLDVTAAKTAFLPTIAVETDYGIEANCFALRCARAAFPETGVVPNLGYFLTAAVNIPVWDWGTLRSKLHQAELRQEIAKAQQSQTQRQAVSELYAAYNEALFARSAVEESRQTAELAAESLRLTNLRYQGGASPATEVVDAETSLVTARNAYIDAEARLRAAMAALQTMTGTF